MTDLGRQLSNPVSTGGGGHNFETRVQALHVVLMLSGGYALCLPQWPISKLQLQARHAGYETDDLIVYARERNGKAQAKLLASIKHTVAITKSNATFKEVIKAAWLDFSNSGLFNKETDSLALFTGILSSTDNRDARTLLEWARTSEDAQEFVRKAESPKFSSTQKKNKLAAFRAQLSRAKDAPVTNKELWSFMRCFYVEVFDFESANGPVPSLLRSLAGESGAWERTLCYVQETNQQGGTITPRTVPKDLIGLSEPRVEKLLGLISWAKERCWGDFQGRDTARLARLETWIRESLARCRERWEALGIPEEMARELANSESIGKPFEGSLPTQGKRLVVIEGDFGTGKSLLAERVFQIKCREYLKQHSGPVPVYIEAQTIVHTVEERVRSALDGLWDPYVQGTFLIVDGLDETGGTKGDAILRDLKVIASSWGSTLVLATSRSLPWTDSGTTRVEMPLLSVEEAARLVYGLKEPTRPHSFNIPGIVREDMRRPFFAILLSQYVRQGNSLTSLSSSLDSLSDVIEICLRKRFSDYRSALEPLKEIAARCIEAGNRSVSLPADMRLETKDDLLQSRLVKTENGDIRFTLPIIAQWFAMRALKDGNIDFSGLTGDVDRLRKWFYPLTLLLGRADYGETWNYLPAVAQRCPGEIARIVSGTISTKRPARETPSLSPVECGTSIRNCCTSLISGLGVLADLIAPLRADGSVSPIATRKTGARLTTAWLKESGDKSESRDLPQDQKAWLEMGAFTIKSRSVSNHEGWPWDWALQDLRDNLRDIVQVMGLPPIPSSQYWKECVWLTALELTGSGELRDLPIPLPDIERNATHRVAASQELGIPGDSGPIGLLEDPVPLKGILSCAKGYRCGTMWKSSSGHLIWPSYLMHEVRRLRNEGIAELACPYQGRDTKSDAHWIWGGFSNEALLERTRQEFTNAVAIYTDLVERWFQEFSGSLSMQRALPARFVGRIFRNQPTGPRMTLYLVCLPVGKESEFDIKIVDSVDCLPSDSAIFAEEEEAVSKWRPSCIDSIPISVSTAIMHSTFKANPGSRLAYEWLCRDLEKIKWLDTAPRFAH